MCKIKSNFLNFNLTILLFPLILFSQEDCSKCFKPSLSVHSGIGNYKIIDKAYSPLSYEGESYPFSVKYKSRKDKKYIHSLFFFYDKSKLSSSITEKYSWSSGFIDYSSSEIDYFLIRKINSKINPKSLDFYIGFGWRNFISTRKFQITNNYNLTSRNFLSSISLYSELRKKINNKHTFNFTFKYSFLSYVYGVVRHPLDTPNLLNTSVIFSNNSNLNIRDNLLSGDILTLQNLVQIESEFGYEYPVFKTINFVIFYRFRFQKINKLLPNTFGNSNLLIGLTLKL